MKDNSLRNRLLVIGLYTSLGVGLLFGALFVFDLMLEQRLMNGDYKSYDRMASTLQILLPIFGLVSIVFGLLLLAQVVLFLMWMYRCYSNLGRLQIQTRFSTGMVIFSWIIPIASFIIPGMLMDDIIKKYDSLLGAFDRRKGLPKAKHLRVFLAVWWTLYVLFGLYNFLTRSDGDDLSVMLFVLLFGGFMAMNLTILLYAKGVGKWEQVIFLLWQSGEVEEFKRRNAPQAQATKSAGQAEWYKEDEETYTPDLDGFVDQKKHQAD